LAAVKKARAEAAAAYFREVAPHWNDIRSLHADDALVEKALIEALAGRVVADLLDVGTGTGRVLEVLGPKAERAVGIDDSREMLAVARARLDAAGLANCSVRQADMYHLPFPPPSFDVVTIHQVLHYADDPASAVAEAARVLRPKGVLALVDFAPHELEELRTRHNHRRLGFGDAEVADWCRAAGLAPLPPRKIPGDPLTVAIWLATKAGES
jgi:ArsR family transcriptional regulator